MTKAYYVLNKTTRQVLNAKGGWSRSFSSYRLAEFETEADAQAAFPADASCEAVAVEKPASRTLRVSASAGLSVEYLLRSQHAFLDKNDKFSLPMSRNEKIAVFESEDAALDKAEALGVALDDVRIFARRMRELPPELAARLSVKAQTP